MKSDNDTMIPIIHPWNMKNIGEKPRDDVHRDGDWHIGIQANIVRPNKFGTFDVLLQQRSGTVDIGRLQYDQSLAVQLNSSDKMDLERALCRGLYEELGIRNFQSFPLHGYKFGIIKRYSYDRTLYNRERIILYTVLTDDIMRASSHKVKGIFWIEWRKFISDTFWNNKKSFTKTSQFYFGNDEVRQSIFDQTMEVLGLKIKNNETMRREERFLLHINDGRLSKTYRIKGTQSDFSSVILA